MMDALNEADLAENKKTVDRDRLLIQRSDVLHLQWPEVARLSALFSLALVVLAGRIDIGRVLPLQGAITELEWSVVFLAIALVLTSWLWWTDRARFPTEPGSWLVLGGFAMLIATVLAADLIADRQPALGYLFDLARMALLLFLLAMLLESRRDIVFFSAVCLMIGVSVGLLEYILWNYNRIYLITQISLSRILVFSMACGMFMFLYKGSKFALFSVFAISTFLLSGSLKVSLLSISALVFVLVLAMVAKREFAALTAVLIALGAGWTVSLMTGDFQNIANRVAVVGTGGQNAAFALPRPPVSDFADSEQGATARELCEDVEAPDLCINPHIVLPDTTERLRMWIYGFRLLNTSPWLGVGADGYDLDLVYYYRQPVLFNYSYPHNVLLGTAVSHGVLHLAAFGIVLLSALALSLAAVGRTTATAAFLAGAGGVFIASMTGGDLYDARYIFVFAIMAGALFAVEGNGQSEPDPRN